MSKFCGSCGAELEKDAKVCGKCGTQVNGETKKIKGLKTTDPNKHKKTKSKIKLAVVLVIICALSIAAFRIISNRTGNKGLLKKVMAAYEDYDINTLIELSSSMYYHSEEGYHKQYLEDTVGGDLDMIELSVGHSYKLSYDIKELYNLSERKQAEMINNIEYTYSDFDTDIIQKISVADIIITAKQEDKSTKQNLRIIMSKENNSWKLLYIE